MPGAFPDLQSFLSELRRRGELVEVAAPVTARLEIAEIHRRVIAAGGPALLFTNVEGADVPCVTNLFGTIERARLAFGERPFELVRRLVELAEELLPPTPAALWGARDVAGDLVRLGVRRRRRPAVLDVVSWEPRLDRLPVLTSWPEDGGPFVTLPLVYTEHLDGHGHNLGMYRMQIHDRASTGMHWQIGKGGGYHYAVAEARGEALPVTVHLGGPPALILGAIAPLPENVPELMLASLVAGRKLGVGAGPDGRRIVADAEIVLAGRVAPGVRRSEGPFGDHYGYYSLAHDYPVFEVAWTGRRRSAVYPATVVGKPRQEDFFLGDLLQELLSPLFPLVMPAVIDLWSYGETGYHSLAGAVVRQRYAREAMASAFRILGEGQLSLTKFLLVTDQAVDLKDIRTTLEHLLARTDVETDLFVFPNLSMDTLDYTGPEVNRGSKGVWLGLGDAKRDLPREFRPPVEPPSEARDPRVFCGGVLVVGAPPFEGDREAAARFAAHPAFAGWPLVVVTDEPARAVASPMNFLWTTFTRFEPAADLHAATTRVTQNHLVRTPPIAIDARMKPWYPKELFADEATSALVDRRWKEYFGDAPVEMGDSGRGHLAPG